MKNHLRALVTGGARRIGAELVRRCAELDFAVTIHAWRSGNEAAELIKTLPNSKLHSVSCCDLSDPAARRKWLSELGHIDLVINNASCYRLTPAGEMESPENRQRYRQVNYLAPLEIINHQLGSVQQNKLLPSIAINLLDCDVLDASGGIKPADEPPSGVDSYLYSRILLAYMTKKLAATAAPQLRINAIAPGPVLPPVNCTTGGMTRILDRVPLHRQVGVTEIADAVEFFYRNASLTGVILPIDGGMHLNN